MKTIQTLSLSLTILQATAWEFPRLQVAFTPQDTAQHRLTLQNDDKIDIETGSQFHGLKTFANLPYVNCFSDVEAKGKGYDVAILGAPFDTVSPVPFAGWEVRWAPLIRRLVRHGAAGSEIRTHGDPDRESEDSCCFGVECLYWYVINETG
jgi:hypothetical protein